MLKLIRTFSWNVIYLYHRIYVQILIFNCKEIYTVKSQMFISLRKYNYEWKCTITSAELFMIPKIVLYTKKPKKPIFFQDLKENSKRKRNILRPSDAQRRF